MSTEEKEVEQIEDNKDENTGENDINFFSMSDEDIMNSEAPEDLGEIPDDDDENNQQEEDDSEEDSASENDEEDDSSSDDMDDKESKEIDVSESDDEDGESEEDSENDDDDSTEEDESDNNNDDEEDSDRDDTEKNEIDYEKEYKELLKPFKASGREIKIDNVDEAKRLMQMGVDYNRKMQSIKPSLRYIKTLQKAKLLDDNKLNYLIDLHNKEPKAIMKLVKESGLDPLEMDLDESKNYKEGDHSISEADSNLDDVIEEIQDTPSYSRTVDVVKNQFDPISRETLYKNPRLISIINDQIANGTYDQIMGEVDKRKALGQFQGMPDLQAYEVVGQELYPINANQSGQGNQAGNGNESDNLKPSPNKQVDKKKVERKKKAAKSVAKKAGKETPRKIKSPLEMSDEEFEKEFDENIGLGS